jgi:hypothetical protein
MIVIPIGRGHSGTRIIGQLLKANGVYMGKTNASADLVPAEPAYKAVTLAGQRVVRYYFQWFFDGLIASAPTVEFRDLWSRYIRPVAESGAEAWGWKLPETSLAYPWIVQMFPDAYYIYWVRDPRDCILKPHKTDDLGRFGAPPQLSRDTYERRAESWLYQYELYRATPKPERLLEMRFEDFIQDQRREIDRLSEFLGRKFNPTTIKPEAVGRWRTSEDHRDFECLRAAIEGLGYE